jgi:hypothetical protein
VSRWTSGARVLLAEAFTNNGTPAKGPERPGSAARVSATRVNGMTSLMVELTPSQRCRAKASSSTRSQLLLGHQAREGGGVVREVLVKAHR